MGHVEQSQWSRRKLFCCFALLVAAGVILLGSINSNDWHFNRGPETIDELLKRRDRMLTNLPPIHMMSIVSDERKLNLTDEEVDRISKYYQDLYPLVSLRSRLSYENVLDENRPQPVLGKQAQARLVQRDRPPRQFKPRLDDRGRQRTASLAILHSDNVRDFITRSGFGFDRFPPLPLKDLKLTEVSLTAFDQPNSQVSSTNINHSEMIPASEPGFDDLLDKEKLGNMDEQAFVQVKYDQWINMNNPLRMPPLPRLFRIHDDSSVEFSGYIRNGSVKDIDHVAGFSHHAVASAARPRMSQPPLKSWSTFAWNKGDDPQSERVWLVTRMQLVSLLKHDVAGVYESEHLPNMGELVDAKTRDLNEFEATSLKRLKAGEDLVTNATTNRIQMVGSLRAENQCLECHSVRRGELLGAFTYELMRKNPMSPIQAND